MPKINQKSKIKNQKLGNSKRTKKNIESETTFSEIENEQTPSGKRLINRRVLILLIVLGLAALFWYKKGWFLAATVDGKPITNLELQIQLNKQFREQALNKLVNDKIFDQFEKEATQKGITVSQEELDKNIKQVEDQYGGAETFNSLLTQQGISREDFVKQVKINLLAEKFFEADIKPTEEEIQKFMDDDNNKLSPEATDAAKFGQLAEKEVRQDKLTTKLREKFQEIKSKVITF